MAPARVILISPKGVKSRVPEGVKRTRLFHYLYFCK